MQNNQQQERQEETIRLKMLDTSCILLSGEINKKMAKRIIEQLLLLEHQKQKIIKLFIDSPGGDVDAGFAIFDMIRFVNAKVYTIGMGLVASAGALVLLAAPPKQRLALPNSHYLIHQPLAGLRGVASDIEIHAEEIEKTKQRLNYIIATETGKKLDEVARDTDRDYWMVAEEAQKYGKNGLVSRIIADHSDITPPRSKK